MPVQGTVDPGQDRNQNYSVFAITGTNGATYGTAQQVPLTATSDGALNVNAVVATGNIPGGTLNRIGSIDTIGTLPSISTTVNPNLPVIAGTPADPGTPLVVRLTDGTSYYNATGGGGGGTNVNIITGTIQSSGTTTGVGTITNLGSFTNGGTIKEITNIAGGTIAVSGVGTTVNVATGTQQTLGTVGTLPGVGTITNIGSISNIGTMPAISLALNTGTITTIVAGTQNTLGTVGVLNAGTINAIASGTITTGTVSVTTGTVGGKAASGAASVANPVLIAGTDAGGTIYAPLVDTTGALKVTGASAGTNVNVVTGTLNAGTINSGTISAGTINAGTFTVTSIAAGTQNTLGTVGSILGIGGTVTVSGASAGTNVQIVNGTVTNVGTNVGLGTVTNLGSFTNGGTIKEITNIAGGTITTTLALNTGTITTIAAGTQNTLGTLGTILGIGGTVQVSGASAGTNVNIVTGTINSGTTIAQTLNLLGTITANGQSVFSQDVSGYRAVSVILAGTFSGNIQPQASNDAGTYYVTNLMDAQDSNNYAHDFGDSRIWYGPITARYFRMTSTSWVSGTAYVEAQFSSQGNNAVIAKNAQIKDSNGNNLSAIGSSLAVTPIGGTVGIVSNLTNGSVNILTGTIQSAGTVTGIGTIPGLGSLTNVGSLTNFGTGKEISNLAGGTLAAVTTVTTVSNVTNGSINILTGTQQLLTTVSNLTNGSVNLLTGTVTSVSNLAGGTVQINPTPVPATLQFGTLGTAGGSFFGTLSAASGAGTKHYITGYSIVQQSGTSDVRILAGTSIQGTGVIVAGNFPAGGGANRTVDPAFATGTNSELIYHFVGAGTAFITVSYWKGV